MDQSDETLRLLFDTHHRQLVERRLRIHSLTERASALLTLMTGWVVLSETHPGLAMKIVLLIAIAVIGLVTLVMLWLNDRAYYEIAGVIARLNEAIGAFETGRFLPDQSLYPQRWKNFGEYRPGSSVLHHLIIVSALTLVCILAIMIK